MLQAVIMAAGRSTRTQPLTSTRPKPLVPIWDRPLLEHQLDQLTGLADEAVIVVGYRQAQIEALVQSRAREIRVRLVPQDRQRGTADALLAARAHIKDKALVINGDDFYHRDDLEALAARGTSILVTTAPDPQNRAVVELEGDRITDIIEKPRSAPDDALCSIGAYVFERDELAELDRLQPSIRGELELPDFIRELTRSRAVRYRRVERIWFPITYAWDVLGILLFLWQDSARAALLGLQSDSEETLKEREDISLGEGVAVEGPLTVGSGTRIDAGASLIGPLALGRGCHVEAGAQLEASVLFERVRVGEGARVSHSVLGAEVEVGAGATIETGVGEQLLVEVKGQRLHPDIPRLGLVAGDRARLLEGARVSAGTILRELP